ncbi:MULTISPECIES: 50S ribosomal protein L4 [unclassified Arthrobacter]|jgi:large subunit ribosomal protein L4|uniref:50S ribosomal protein L4, sunset domain variant n=1 Tax=unclassified Arthrobacter TaxID=235627 RepID=UPI00159D1A81|nr:MULTISPECIES: 50S ribosomal protein L4 [unclassified Arthrobacter]MCQ9164594.1 50S ribosomal protein L4 [Arthrobacter sp. STN4]NVM97163.1 50S ribosomal protein L4 [Arthrobacter sp. SDTb3-6]
MATVKVDLPAEIFDVQTNVPLLHQVVVAQLAAARQGTHKTKTRAEVSGAGRKPFAQKGTGRARQGSIRAPHMTGGGIVHGPTPRDYSQRTPKKMKAAALRGALSDRARNGRIHVVSELVSGTKPSTKSAKALLATVSERKNLLVVIERSNDVAALSVRNITNIHVLYVDQLNTYDVLVADDVVFTEAAYEIFISGRAAAEAFASSLVLVEEEVSADAAEGTIKGNKDSMKYHVPGSRWYDATVAEVWFATVEDAKAAGFVPAGGEAAQTIEEDAK